MKLMGIGVGRLPRTVEQTDEKPNLLRLEAPGILPIPPARSRPSPSCTKIDT